MCEKDLGLPVCGVELPTWSELIVTPRPVIWLIGMRSVGKTTMGRAAAQMLNWEFLDLDETIGFDVHEYVQTNGWDAFREVGSRTIRK